MPLSTDCTLTGTWPQIDGITASGHVVVEPVQSVTGGGYIVVDVPISVPLVAGSISKAFTSLAGVQLRITERIHGARVDVPPYVVTPISGTLDLSTAPRGTGEVLPTYVLGSSVGQPGGVAALDGSGKVPVGQLPAGATGVLDVTAANGTIVVGGTGQHPTVRVGAIAESAVTGLPADLVSILGVANAAGSAASGAATSATAAHDAADAAQATATEAVPKSTVTAKGDLVVGTASATVARLAVGSNGATLVADSTQSSGVKWAPGGSGIKAHASTGLKTTQFGPGDTSGTWTVCPTDYQVTIAAAVGDVLRWEPSVIAAQTAAGEFDVAALVGGAPARYYSSGTSTQAAHGHGGLYMDANYSHSLKPITWVVDAADVSGGTVTLAVMYRAAGAGVLFGSSAYPSQIDVDNLGTP
jgi:hypothetical protein